MMNTNRELLDEIDDLHAVWSCDVDQAEIGMLNILKAMLSAKNDAERRRFAKRQLITSRNRLRAHLKRAA